MKKTFVLLIGLAGIFAAIPSVHSDSSSNSAVSVGAGIRYICQTSAPAPVGRARDWVRCSDGHRMYTTAGNVDSDLTVQVLNAPSVINYGALCDGATDDTAAIQAGINALKVAHVTSGGNSLKGGVLGFPPGAICVFSSPLNLDDTSGMTLQGVAGYSGGFPLPTSVLLYTGTGTASAISARSTGGFTIDSLAVTYSSSNFTGNLIDLSHSATATDTFGALITRSFLGSYNSSPWSAAALVYMDKAVSSKISDSLLAYAKVGVLFRVDNSSYSNMNTIDNVLFHDFQTAATLNAFQQDIITNCTFENNSVHSGTQFMAPAYSDTTNGGGSGSEGVVFSNNYVGDGDGSTNGFETTFGGAGSGGTCGSTNTGGAIGLVMTGNFFGAHMCLKNTHGSVIEGNAFNEAAGALSSIIFIGTNNDGLAIRNNGIVFQTTITGTPNEGNIVDNTSWNPAWTIANATYGTQSITGALGVSGTLAVNAILPASGNVSIDSPGTESFGTSTATQIAIGRVGINTLLNGNIILFGDATTSQKTFAGNTGSSDTAGATLLINASQGGTASASGGGAGGVMAVRGGLGGTASASFNPGAGGIGEVLGGNAGTGGTGNANGGNALIDGGAKSGTGTGGQVLIGSSANTSLVSIATSSGKIGLYGATAVTRPSSTGNTATSAAGSTTSVFTNTTFTGGTGSTAYTVGDVVLALKQLGAIAP